MNQTSIGDFTPEPGFCASAYPATLDAGALTVSGPGVDSITLQPQEQSGIFHYAATLPAGSLLGGAYQISGSGSDSVGPFTNTSQIPAPIAISSSLQPGAKLPSTLTLNWTGGDSRSVVTAQYIVGAFRAEQTVSADQGTMQFDGIGGSQPQPFPKGAVEIIVIQQPAASGTSAFPVSGVTLGIKQTWRYTFDYKQEFPHFFSAKSVSLDFAG